ncbi:hypothetical protein cypCar_00032543 [Cyprinus carpio]|nr:hypothetical protein cypCar_00032543 [Cyprinus carpio]
MASTGRLTGSNIVIFGAVDGFSRRCIFINQPFIISLIFYLDVAGNNKAKTAFGFHDGVEKNGWPSRLL